MSTTESVLEPSNLDMKYDNMLTSAEININNRPCISSFKDGHAISFLVIPTLEDLKSTIFESGDLVQEVGYPAKVTTMQDIESAAFLAYLPPGVLGHHSTIPIIASRMTEMLIESIHSFIEECRNHGGTTKIIDADGLTELSLEGLLKKYYP